MDIYSLLLSQLDPQLHTTTIQFELCVKDDVQDENAPNLCFDILNLGILTALLHSIGLSRSRMWNDPNFDGVSFADVAKMLRAKESLISLIDVVPDESSDPLEPVLLLLTCIEERVLGLSLEDFRTEERSVRYTY